jgi:hypothetical protein
VEPHLRERQVLQARHRLDVHDEIVALHCEEPGG